MKLLPNKVKKSGDLVEMADNKSPIHSNTLSGIYNPLREYSLILINGGELR